MKLSLGLISLCVLGALVGCGGFSSKTASIDSSSLTCPTGPMTCVFLAWQETDTVAGFHVWYGNTSGSYTTKLDAGTSLTYMVSGLAPGTYYFAVTAYNAQGDSGYSNEISTNMTTQQEITKRGEHFVSEMAIVIPSHSPAN